MASGRAAHAPPPHSVAPAPPYLTSKRESVRTTGCTQTEGSGGRIPSTPLIASGRAAHALPPQSVAPAPPSLASKRESEVSQHQDDEDDWLHANGRAGGQDTADPSTPPKTPTTTLSRANERARD